MTKPMRRVRDAHRAVIPRAVQKVLASLLAKRTGGRPHFHERQHAARKAMLLAFDLDTVEAISKQILDASGQTLLEETFRALSNGVELARDGYLDDMPEGLPSSGSHSRDDLQCVRLLLHFWDQEMNDSELSPPDDLDPLPSRFNDPS